MKPLPALCSWVEVAAIAVIAVGAGFGLGLVTGDVFLPHDTGWFPVLSGRALDGDSIIVEILVHLDDVNAPELDGICEGEQALAEQAKARVNALLAGEPRRIHLYESDEQGRVRAGIVAGDRNVASVLTTEKLAVRMVRENGRNRPWCRDQAESAPGPRPAVLAWQ